MVISIHKLLLQRSNRTRCGSGTVGGIIAETGKEQLWSERTSPIIDVVVVHYMSAVERFPENPYYFDNIISLFAEYGVSSHFIITRRGTIYQLVPERQKAWHCGGSIMPQPDGRCNVNEFSIGIELLATASSGFTRSQYRSLGMLCCSIEQSNGSMMTYVGHDQVAGAKAVEMGLRGDCKVDPGPFFDWKRFFREIDRHRREGAVQLPK